MFRRFFRVLFLGALFVTQLVSTAGAENPIDGQIDDPVFVQLNTSYTAENKNSVGLYFGTDSQRCRDYYGNNYYSSCRPRLGLDGRRAVAGISMSPAIKGEWRWSGDYRLTFVPEEHWLADQNYVVELNLDDLQVPERVIFAKNQRRITLNVKTSPLRIDIRDMTYMQDPDDPARKVVTARLDMNYPVIADTLDQAVRLSLEKVAGDRFHVADETLSYELQFEPNNIRAHLAVPVKTLPEEDHYMQLNIIPGVKPAHGGQDSARNFNERARVPSLKTYLAVKSAAAVIARAEDGTPEQLVSFEMNVKAKAEDIRAKTKLYLLPHDHPVMGRGAGQASAEPYRWQAANEVTPSILDASELLTLAESSQDSAYSTNAGFGFNAPAGRYVYVSLEKGLEAFGGYTLENNYEAILQVPSYPHDIEIMQEGSILSLSGSQKLSLHARGTDRLQVEVAQILPSALQHFISQTQGDIRNPSFTHWSFDKEDIAHIDTRDVKMAYASAHASQYSTFDFAPYLKEGRKGIFLLNIRGFKDDKYAGDSSQRFVLVTDLGLLVKRNADQSRDVFLASFRSGAPVAEARVSVLGRNGLEIFKGVSDAQGHILLPDFSGYSRDRYPVAIIAQKGDDYAFIPYDRRDRVLNTSRFDVGGTRIAAQGLNAFLFSDRGIYRPGETARIGMIVKNANWQALPPRLPLQIVITDPRGRIVQDQVMNFSAPGLEEISLQTGDAWPTGQYFVNLYISNDGQQGSLLGNTSIRVEEFQPDRLKIKAEFIQDDVVADFEEGWLRPEGLKSNVVLTNLYGAAASDRKIKTQVRLNPARLSFKSFPDYVFYDAYAAKHRNVNYDLPSVQTDQAGYAEIPLQLEDQPRATYLLSLETTGFEAGSGKGVTAYSSALVSPMDYVVGYKSDANLAYLNKGGAYEVHLKALDSRLDPVAVKDLSLVLVKRSFVSTLVKRGDGSYAYESVPKEEEISAKDFSLAAGGTPLVILADELGDFAYRLKTKDGLVVANIAFGVAGQGQRAGGLDKEAVLKVKTNKSSYGAGESIALNITAPYTGAGLITLESDKVLTHKWFKTDKTETVQSITIPEEFSGKGYVNVAFVRDMNAREIYMSPLSHAIVPFTANTESRAVQIDLDVAAKVKPGVPLTIKYKGNKKGKAVIFAVDEGILQVAKYKTPDPVAHFLLNRALQVETSQMLDLLMPEFALLRELSADGGGASLADAVLGKHLNPFRRKILAPAVYWSGVVELDQQERSLSFTPPGHFNGQLRVMAVAVGAESVGSTAEDITVRADIVLTPNMPVFLAPGDEAEGSVTISNGVKGTGASAQLSILLEPSEGLRVTKALPEKVDVPEGEERSFTFTVKAIEALGAAQLKVHAMAGEAKQTAEATLSIRPPVARETTMQTGYTRNGKAGITLARDLYPDFATSEISVSALPTAYIFGLLRYLDGFPYGCTEQITSRIYPQLSLMNMPEMSFAEEDARQKVGQLVATLRARQTRDGGFALWHGGYEASDFISVYVMDFLTQARNADFPVPSDLVQRGLSYLRSWVNQDIKSMQDARNKSYGIYVLTRSGFVTSNEILHWLRYFEQKKSQDWKTDLAAVYLAASYEMMQQKKLAHDALDAFEEDAFANEMSYKNTDWSKPYYNPFIKYAGYVSLLARHFPDRFKDMDDRVIFKLADFLQSNRYNTISASFAIQALSDFTVARQDALSDAQIKVVAGGRDISLAGKRVLKAPLPLEEKEIEIHSGADKAFSIGDKAVPFFYTVTQEGYSRARNQEVLANGIEVARTYRMPDGSDWSGQVQMGDVIEAVITVRAHGNARVENVAIVDLLPAGLALEQDTQNAGSTLFPEFVDRREDRIIIFTDVAPAPREYHYRLRAVSKGVFEVPPPYAEAMYDLSKKARGEPGRLTVTDENE